MSTLPICPKCAADYTYEDGALLICPTCSHEWAKSTDESATPSRVVRDSNGNELKDGDSVTVIKDLKVRGASSSIKVGTKVKSIRLIDPDEHAGHDIDCKIDGFGAMQLKSEFVKKA